MYSCQWKETRLIKWLGFCFQPYIYFSLWSLRDPLSFLVRTCKTSAERCFNGEVTFAWYENASICCLQNIPGSKEQLTAIFFEQKKAKQIPKYTTARGKNKSTHQFFIRDLSSTITHILPSVSFLFFSSVCWKFSEKDESGQDFSPTRWNVNGGSVCSVVAIKIDIKSFEFDSFRDGILS